MGKTLRKYLVVDEAVDGTTGDEVSHGAEEGAKVLCAFKNKEKVSDCEGRDRHV